MPWDPYNNSNILWPGASNPTYVQSERAPARSTARSLTPAQASGYHPAYGGKPQVPDPEATAAAAIAANMANMAQLQQLFGNLNTFNAGQALNQMRLNMPNYDALRGQQSGVIGEQLAGRMPQDVVDLLIQQGAERGWGIGSPGSSNAIGSTALRYLGGSLGQIERGMRNMSAYTAETPTAPLANPASMFITPDAVQSAQMAANLYNSSFNPYDQAMEARRWGTVGSPRPVGGMAGARLPGGGLGSGATPWYSPDYSTYGGGALGPFEDKSDDYSNWLSWVTNLPAGGNTSGNQPRDPQPWGAPIYDPDYEYGAGSGFDWGTWDTGGVEDPGYNPLFDVSQRPDSGGDWMTYGGGY